MKKIIAPNPQRRPYTMNVTRGPYQFDKGSERDATKPDPLKYPTVNIAFAVDNSPREYNRPIIATHGETIAAWPAAIPKRTINKLEKSQA